MTTVNGVKLRIALFDKMLHQKPVQQNIILQLTNTLNCPFIANFKCILVMMNDNTVYISFPIESSPFVDFGLQHIVPFRGNF